MCSVCDSPLGRDILADDGRPHVRFDVRALTYGDVFPGRTDPLSDPAYRAVVIAERATEKYHATVPRGIARAFEKAA